MQILWYFFLFFFIFFFFSDSLFILSKKDSKPKGVVDLDDTCNVETANAQAKPNAFQINTKERIFYISAGNATLRDQWISAIKEIVNV